MFKILRGGDCYTPDYIGTKDILMAFGKIIKIEDSIPVQGLWDVEEFDCTNKYIFPGIIDQHVHITGGGGEEGPGSRIPELMLSELLKAGISTVVGVLGVDDITRNVANLLAKARSLQLEGATTYIYTGSYGVPTATLTGKSISDMVLIDKVIGIGEIAIADYRSSHPTVQMLKEIAYEAKVGGMISSKAGVVHIHVGEGKDGLGSLFELVEESDFPVEMFVPTHLNRSKNLFEQAKTYAKLGGVIDLTAGEKPGKAVSVPEALEDLIKCGIDMGKVTVSSDGNGSMPAEGNNGSGVGSVAALFNDIKSSIIDKKINISTALKTVTENVAHVLKLYPAKGTVKVGSDADILVTDKRSFAIDSMFIGGNTYIQNGSIIRKGKYES
jgi:beta-aspartyl-dipeptidase (metallo-type)